MYLDLKFHYYIISKWYHIDAAALIALKNSLSGDSINNWSGDSIGRNYCDWTGVKCEFTEDLNNSYVSELNLNSESLSGKSDVKYRVLLVSSLIFC